MGYSFPCGGFHHYWCIICDILVGKCKNNYDSAYNPIKTHIETHRFNKHGKKLGVRKFKEI